MSSLLRWSRLYSRGSVGPRQDESVKFRQSVLSSVRWSAIQGFGQRTIDALVFFLLARILGPESLGTVAIAGMLLALLEPLYKLGMDTALIQRENLEDDHLDTAFWLVLGASWLVATMVFLSAGIIATWFGQPELEDIIHWLSIGIALRGFIVVQDAQFRRALNYRPLTIRTLAATLIGGAVGISCALAGLGAYSLVAQGLTASAISAILIWTLSAWRPNVSFSKRHAAELFAFARSVLGFSFIRIFNSKSPGLIVGYFLGPSAAAYFAVADRIYWLVIELITQTINRVSVPMFSRIQNEPARLWRIFVQATSLVALISFPVCVGIALVAPDAIPLVLGKYWQDSALAVQIVILAGVSASVSFFNGALLVGIGRPELRLYAAGIRAVAGTLLFSLLHFWGIAGIAVAFLLRAALSEPIQLVFLSRAFQPFRWEEYWRGLSGALSATVIMAVVVIYISNFLPTTLDASVTLGIEVISGTLTYVLASLATNRRTLLNAARLVRTARVGQSND
jgi:PST family polysaccharide transporter